MRGSTPPANGRLASMLRALQPGHVAQESG
eukprot:COSAG01_NODE_64813_length_275_cov_0.590909_1_plen_29_part_01